MEPSLHRRGEVMGLRNWWRLRMFKGCNIKLSGPICNCPEEDLGWHIRHEDGNRHGLSIICRACKTELRIPYAKMTACFVLESPYPGVKKQEVAPGLKLVRPEDETKKEG